MDQFPGARTSVIRPAQLLSADLMARLERLQLGTRRRLAGVYAGEHRSPRHGSSPDFADHRDYHPGDDFRRIDYNLYARLGVLLIKLFEASDELHLHVVVDTSASMATKLDTAQRVAAAFGFVALVNRDPVTIHTVPGRGPAPRFNGRGSASALFDHLGSLVATGTTPLGAGASRMLARPGPQGLTVLISDLLTPEWEDALRRLPARGADLVVVHTLDPTDVDPEPLGDVDLIDREDGARVAVTLTPETVARFRREVQAWTERVAAACRRAGAAYLHVRTDEPLEEQLFTEWRRAGVLR